MNTDSPLVSVIIPAYNAEAFLRETLNSVLAQTYKNIEVLVVDDGSQDQTAEIVRSFTKIDRRVQLLQQSNAGVAAARNLAIQKSRGDYIAPIDADDIWYPSKLEKQVNLILQSEPSVGLVYAWSVYINESGMLTNTCQISILEGDVYIPLIQGSFLGNASSPLIDRQCFRKVGGYNCQLRAENAQGCEDWEMYLRIAEHYQFRVVKEILIGYRQVTGSMSFNYQAMQKSTELLIADVQKRHPEIPGDIYRWATSNFSWYLALRGVQRGDFQKAIFYLLQSAKTDFLPLLRPAFYKIFIYSALMILCQPITSFLVDFFPSIREPLLERFSGLRPTYRLSDLNRCQLKNLHRFPRKQYIQLLNFRWSQITKQRKRILENSSREVLTI
ncbi:MAG: glycosyltransferase family 2 protein [Leptolyngbyaceae bacterium]|nr:glycosyltransferase family 2 protein [Leptolyngbyaceae bacterium]